MSCKECEKAQENALRYYYRWDKANICMSGCTEHITEVFDILTEHQKIKRKEP